MRITIVDDVASERQTLRCLLEQYAKDLQLSVQIQEFDNGKAFLSCYNGSFYVNLIERGRILKQNKLV